MISIDSSLILVILNFVLLLFVLDRILYVPIKKFLEERQKKISEEIDSAQQSREEAEELVGQRKTELRESAEEVRKMKKLARRDAEDQANEIIRYAKQQEKKILQDTDLQLKQEKKKAINEVETDLAFLISDLSAKVVAKKMDQSGDDALIGKIIAERSSK